MSKTVFEEFRAKVLADSSLRDELQNINERDEFVQRVVKLATEQGFELSVDNVENAMNAGRRAWIERWI